MPHRIYKQKRAFLVDYISPEERKTLSSLITEPTKQDLLVDTFLLRRVLTEAGIELPPGEGLAAEVQNWDRTHLLDLAKNVGRYTRSPADAEKLRFLIKHSMDEDLVDTLVNPNEDNIYSKYNHHVLGRMDRQGVDVQGWLEPGDNLSHSNSFNPKKPFSLDMVGWERDFRKEYAMGNVSECCIGIDDTQKNDRFKPVLLDYFLDLSIKVLHMKVDGKSIGQTYLVALDHKGSPTMGISSVELARDYRTERGIVTPIMVLLIGNTNTYQSEYGFEGSIMGDRFGVFRNYLARRSELIHNMGRDLKAKRNKTKQKIRTKGLAGEDVSELDQLRKRLGQEVGLLEKLHDQLPQRSLTVVRKAGLKEAAEAGCTYLGTNYLDLFAKRDEEGFFRPSHPLPRELKKYYLTDARIFARIESTLTSLKNTYFKKK